MIIFGETLYINLRFKLSDSFIGPLVIGRTENFLSEILPLDLGLRCYQLLRPLLLYLLAHLFLVVRVRETEVSIAPRPALFVLFDPFFRDYHFIVLTQLTVYVLMLFILFAAVLLNHMGVQ